MLGQITVIGRCALLKKTDFKKAQEGLKNAGVLDFKRLEMFHGSNELSENNAKLLDNIIRVTESFHFKTRHLSQFVKTCHDITEYQE